VDFATMVIAGAWFIGAFVNGLTGMGGALISLPIISLVISSKSVIVISLMTGAAVGILSFLFYARLIPLREAATYWMAALPGLVLGALTLKLVDIHVLQMLLAVIITVNIAVQLFQNWLGTCMAPRKAMKYICGFFTGFFGGALGIPGPIMAIYASLMCMDKDTARGFFISAIRQNGDIGTLDDTQGQNTQKALGIDAALIHFNPDAGLEFIGFLNKVCSLPVVQAGLTLHD
jgi:uncharacterized membrane protein YfcA